MEQQAHDEIVIERFKHVDKNGNIQVKNMSLDWRWHRAKYLVDTKSPMSRRLDDEAVGVCRALVRARQSGRPRAMEALQRRYPYLFLAYQLYCDPSCPLRWELEAALLTKAESEQIGRFLAVGPVVPAVYENIFFNVRPFYYSPSFIHSQVILPAYKRSMTGYNRMDVILKVVAYHCGWDTYTRFVGRGVLPPEAQRSIDALIEGMIRENALTAARLQTITPWNTKDVMESWEAMQKRHATMELLRPARMQDVGQQEVAQELLSTHSFYKLTDREEEPQDDVEIRAIDMIRQYTDHEENR